MQNLEPYIKKCGELQVEVVHANRKMEDDNIENLDDYSKKRELELGMCIDKLRRRSYLHCLLQDGEGWEETLAVNHVIQKS